VFASVCTIIITTFLSLLIYTNVIIEEALNKNRIIERAFKRVFKLPSNFQIKIKNSYFKLRTILILSSTFRRKIIKEDLEKLNKNNNISNQSLIKNTNLKSDYKNGCSFKNPYEKLDNLPENENQNKNFLQNFFNHGIFKTISKLKFPLQTPTLAENVRSRHQHKRQNAYVKSDVSKIETTNFYNQNTLLFSRNNYTKTFDKKENDNNLKGNNDNSYGFSKNDGLNLNPEKENYDPVIMTYFNKTMNENSSKDYFKTKIFINFQIECFEIVYESSKINKINKNRKKYKLFEMKKRHYIFPTNKNIFTCQQISITSPQVLDYLANLIKTQIKTIIILFIYLYIWLYLMVFIQSIYKQYGNNIIKICIMPLVSVLVIKLAITFNLMMFITTLILYLRGDYFMNTSKLPLIHMIIFKGFVPPLAFHHYRALRIFRDLIKNN